jgi:predicted sulfurtransferase
MLGLNNIKYKLIKMNEFNKNKKKLIQLKREKEIFGKTIISDDLKNRLLKILTTSELNIYYAWIIQLKSLNPAQSLKLKKIKVKLREELIHSSGKAF